MTNYKNKGFSLVELLVVIGIIAILTAIVMTNLTQPRTKSRDAKRVSDLSSLQLALELYFDRCNKYPLPTGTYPAASIPNLTDTTNCSVSFQTFITQIPTPPTTDSADLYGYYTNPASPSSGSPALDYVLRAKLETNNTAVLSDDVDTITGLPLSAVDCSDSISAYYYCVQPK